MIWPSGVPRNDLAAMAAIDAKVGVGGQDDGVGERLGHPHAAGIGEGHRDVGVFLHERHDPVHLIGQVEGQEHGGPDVLDH
jgi:hypothetical protein